MRDLSPLTVALLAGAGNYDEIHQPGEPGRFPPPDRGAAGHRDVLHSLVLCVSFVWPVIDLPDTRTSVCKQTHTHILNSTPFRYEVTSTKYTRDVYKELLISLVASLFMGFGVLFLLLWVGIYV